MEILELPLLIIVLHNGLAMIHKNNLCQGCQNQHVASMKVGVGGGVAKGRLLLQTRKALWGLMRPPPTDPLL